MEQNKRGPINSVELSKEDFKQLLHIREKMNDAEQKSSIFRSIMKGIDQKKIITIANDNILALKILMFFIENTEETNAIVVSQTYLGEIFSAGRKSINNAINDLVVNGIIEIGKVGNIDFYILNTKVVWQQARNTRKYSSFKGTIILERLVNNELFEKNSEYIKYEN